MVVGSGWAFAGLGHPHTFVSSTGLKSVIGGAQEIGVGDMLRDPQSQINGSQNEYYVDERCRLQRYTGSFVNRS